MSPQPRGRLLTHGYGDEELDGEVDDEHAGGGLSPLEVDSGGVSPLRSSPAAAFCLPVSGFVFLCRPLWKNIGGPDRKSTRLNSSHITRSRMPSSA